MADRKFNRVSLVLWIGLIGVSIWLFTRRAAPVPAQTVADPAVKSVAIAAEAGAAGTAAKGNPEQAGQNVTGGSAPMAPGGTDGKVEIERESFNLDEHDYAAIVEKEKAAGSPTGAGDGVDDQVLLDFLVRAGVEFPARSRLAYANGLLFVTNTRENLAKIPRLLDDALHGGGLGTRP